MKFNLTLKLFSSSLPLLLIRGIPNRISNSIFVFSLKSSNWFILSQPSAGWKGQHYCSASLISCRSMRIYTVRSSVCLKVIDVSAVTDSFKKWCEINPSKNKPGRAIWAVWQFSSVLCLFALVDSSPISFDFPFTQYGTWEAIIVFQRWVLLTDDHTTVPKGMWEKRMWMFLNADSSLKTSWHHQAHCVFINLNYIFHFIFVAR